MWTTTLTYTAGQHTDELYFWCDSCIPRRHILGSPETIIPLHNHQCVVACWHSGCVCPTHRPQSTRGRDVEAETNSTLVVLASWSCVDALRRQSDALSPAHSATRSSPPTTHKVCWVSDARSVSISFCTDFIAVISWTMTAEQRAAFCKLIIYHYERLRKMSELKRLWHNSLCVIRLPSYSLRNCSAAFCIWILREELHT